MPTITLDIPEVTNASLWDLNTGFLQPLDEFVTQQGLGSITVMFEDQNDDGNVIEFTVSAFGDNYGYFCYTALRVDGVGFVLDEYGREIYQGTWLLIAKGWISFFKLLARSFILPSEQYSKLCKAGEMLA